MHTSLLTSLRHAHNREIPTERDPELQGCPVKGIELRYTTMSLSIPKLPAVTSDTAPLKEVDQRVKQVDKQESK